VLPCSRLLRCWAEILFSEDCSTGLAFSDLTSGPNYAVYSFLMKGFKKSGFAPTRGELMPLFFIDAEFFVFDISSDFLP